MNVYTGYLNEKAGRLVRLVKDLENAVEREDVLDVRRRLTEIQVAAGSVLDEVDKQREFVNEHVIAEARERAEQANRIEFDTVVAKLRGHGIKAYVEQTGGGCATILVGEEKDGRWEAAVGPGWFDEPGWSRGCGTTADLWVGKDDEGDTGEAVELDATEDTVVDLVKKYLAE